MATKINIFYPFDKAFFGKPLREFKHFAPEISTTKPIKHQIDSISDFYKHFERMAMNPLERTPKQDIVTKQKIH